MLLTTILFWDPSLALSSFSWFISSSIVKPNHIHHNFIQIILIIIPYGDHLAMMIHFSPSLSPHGIKCGVQQDLVTTTTQQYYPAFKTLLPTSVNGMS